MPTPSALRALVALLIICSPRAQQDPNRGAFAGWVCDNAGKRVVGADVVLLSRPWPGRLDIGVADDLRVQTATNGMFRAELLHSRAYSCWATWRDAGGTEHRTKILEAALPGPPRGLDEAPQQMLRSLRIEGAAAWQARAPLSVTAFTADENILAVPLHCDADMVAVLPAMPGDWCSVEVRGADGFLIYIDVNLYLGDPKLTAATIALPTPRELRVVVVDEKGATIAGARVAHSLGHHHRNLTTDIGTTDADGLVRAIVPASNPMYQGESNGSCIVIVEAPGRQRLNCWVDLRKVESDLRVTLPPGIEMRGRLLAKDGGPVRDITLLPDCYAIGSDAETTGAGVPPRQLALDAEGRFAFASLHPRYDFRLLAIIEPAAAIAAGMRLRPGIAVAPVMWLATGRAPFASPFDLGDLRFDALPVAQIEVKTDAGVPVPGARLEVTTPDLYNSPVHYVCDRVGRLQFPLPQGEIRIGAWVPGGGVATHLVRVPAAADDPAIEPLVLRLSATRTVSGIVVDGDGKPVAGATVYQWDRAKTKDRQIAELTFHGRATSEPTGADGSFALTLPLDDVPFDIRAFGKGLGQPYASENLVIMPDDLNVHHLRLLVTPLPPAK